MYVLVMIISGNDALSNNLAAFQIFVIFIMFEKKYFLGGPIKEYYKHLEHFQLLSCGGKF